MAESIAAGVQAAPVVSWRVHLARRQPLRAAAAIFLIIGASAAAYLIWLHPLAAAAAGFLMLSAVAEFLLPITYRIGPDGAWCRSFLSLRHLKWAEVKRCYRDAEGIKLSPLRHRSRLEAYRGIYLWLGDDGAAVVQVVRAYVKEAAP